MDAERDRLGTPSTAFVSGAGGFIGARIVRELLDRGCVVYALGRPRGGEPWSARLRAALDDILGSPTDPRNLERLHAVEARLGESSGDGVRLGALPDVEDAWLFHLAGDTRFTSAAPPEQRAVNVGAGPGLVEALGSRLSKVVHVGTAYVAGTREGVLLESELEAGQAFRNGYEETKLEGERRMMDAASGRGLPLVRLRPAIVVNDSQTGRSSAFTHLNALVEIVRRLQRHFDLAFGETVSDRVRTPLAADGRPNLIPVDAVVRASLEIAGTPGSAGRAYHLCHPAPPRLADVIGLLLEALEIDRRLRVEFGTTLDGTATHTERMVAKAFKPYAAYLDARCAFDVSNVRQAIPSYDRWFSPPSAAYLSRVVATHRAAGWSRE